ncbi:MAG: hypothetical protein OER22_02860 [Gammaproteobacteria bacterium]|nr:hypothetical protein [Gammaproteobacteria bacterium]MDH3372141.1 hypothetical protein [Gammaproteobacteria bacterium]MDH3551532.1 hypothetical protein [Gammaproteobacteria bacterium]
MTPKRYPLPKRFNAALSEKAYEQLRALNEQYHYGNNYLLTIILENFESIADLNAVEQIFSKFADEYGAPAAGGMKRKT